MSNRLLTLDLYRALGVILMVIFHFTYDLHHFGFIEVDTTKNTFWIDMRIFIVSIFMSAVGMSLYIVYAKSFHTKKYFKRLGLLASASLAISVVTYFLFPYTWIYFGVLHMIFVASVIGPLFTKKPNISGALGVLIVGVYLLGYRMTFLFDWVQAPLHLPIGHTEDLAPFIPWFGVVLLGIFVMHHKLLERFTIKSTPFLDKTAFLGRHSLAIYLGHQPILFAFLGSIAYLIK